MWTIPAADGVAEAVLISSRMEIQLFALLPPAPVVVLGPWRLTLPAKRLAASARMAQEGDDSLRRLLHAVVQAMGLRVSSHLHTRVSRTHLALPLITLSHGALQITTVARPILATGGIAIVKKQRPLIFSG